MNLGGAPEGDSVPYLATLFARAKRPLALSVGFAAGIYLLAVFATDEREVWVNLSRLEPSTWFVVLLLPIGNYVLRFSRWHWYLGTLGNSISVRRDLQAYVAGFALTTTPGKIGEVVRSVFLQEIAIPYRHSIAAFVAERFSDLIAISVLATLALTRFDGHGWFVAMAFVLIAVALWSLLSGSLERRLSSGPARLSGLKNLLHGAVATLEGCRVLLSFRLLVGGLVVGLLAWSLEGLALWIVLNALGTETEALLAIGIYAISTLAGALSFVPGGLGPMEGVMGGLLILLGVTPANAVTATLVTRVATLWMAVFLGMVAMATLLAFRGPTVPQSLEGEVE